jgi:epoxyqueuosine reductase
MSLTQEIKDFALDLGYTKVGVTPAEDFPNYAKELLSRGQGYDWYVESHRQPLAGTNLTSTLPGARSILTVAFDYARTAFPEALVGRVGRLYQARVHNQPPHRIHGARFQLLRQFLERRGCDPLSGAVVPERWVAARAGTVTFGKNNFAFAEGIGSWVILGSFILEQELEFDAPTMEVRCPPSCEACVKACPTKALSAPLKLDPRRCIAFNTFMTQDGQGGGVTSHIPLEIRGMMGTWIHGCDICQEVCPRNQARLRAKLPEDPYLEKVAKDFSLKEILRGDDAYFARNVLPLMSSYMTDKKYFRRNAAIAMGNLGDPGAGPDLALAMLDPEPVVRHHAAWALGRIGGALARKSLEGGLQRAPDEFEREAIKMALAQVPN